jgi:hypothetical protein
VTAALESLTACCQGASSALTALTSTASSGSPHTHNSSGEMEALGGAGMAIESDPALQTRTPRRSARLKPGGPAPPPFALPTAASAQLPAGIPCSLPPGGGAGAPFQLLVMLQHAATTATNAVTCGDGGAPRGEAQRPCLREGAGAGVRGGGERTGEGMGDSRLRGLAEVAGESRRFVFCIVCASGPPCKSECVCLMCTRNCVCLFWTQPSKHSCVCTTVFACCVH